MSASATPTSSRNFSPSAEEGDDGLKLKDYNFEDVARIQRRRKADAEVRGKLKKAVSTNFYKFFFITLLF